MREFALILLVAVGTYLIRASTIVAFGRIDISPRIERGLGLVAPAVLAALVVNTLVLDAGAPRPLGAWHLAALLAAAVAWRWRSMSWTLAAGMIAVWIFALAG